MDLRTSTRSSRVGAPVAAAWAVVAAAGPGPHWYADAAPFRFRGALDRLVGGEPAAPVPDRPTLAAGDRAGFWRVRRADGRVLDLEAVVRAPGTVRFATTLEPVGDGTRLTQSVSFTPAGPLGAAYLLADLPAREALLELVHRRTLAEVDAQPRQT